MNFPLTVVPTNEDSRLEIGQAPSTRRTIMTLGDKGGSSKSFLARKLAEIHLAASKPGLLLVDGDESVGSLAKFYAERTSDGSIALDQTERGVALFALHGKVDARDHLVNDLLQRGRELVIVDMPATALTKLREISEDYNFGTAVATAGYRLTVLAPITPYDDTILDLQETIQLLDPEIFAEFTTQFDAVGPREGMKTQLMPRVDYVAVVNLGMAEDRQDFDLWDDPTSFTRALLAFIGGVELEFPRMRPRIAAKLAKFRLSFSDGETAEQLAITDRSRLTAWNLKAESVLRSAGGLLGFNG